MEDFRTLRKRAGEALEIAAKMRNSADQDAWLKVAYEFFRLAKATDDTRPVLARPRGNSSAAPCFDSNVLRNIRSPTRHEMNKERNRNG